jgi:hypothetical protein
MNKAAQPQTIKTRIEQISGNIVHVQYFTGDTAPKPSVLIDSGVKPVAERTPSGFCEKDSCISFRNASGVDVLQETGHAPEPKEVYKYNIDGDPMIWYKHTANGDVAYIANARWESKMNQIHKMGRKQLLYTYANVFYISETLHVYLLKILNHYSYNYPNHLLISMRYSSISSTYIMMMDECRITS